MKKIIRLLVLGCVLGGVVQPEAAMMKVMCPKADGTLLATQVDPLNTIAPTVFSLSYEWTVDVASVAPATTPTTKTVTRYRYFAPLYYGVNGYYHALMPLPDGSWRDVSGVVVDDAGNQGGWPHGDSAIVSRSKSTATPVTYDADPLDEGATIVAFSSSITPDSLVDNLIPYKRTSLKGVPGFAGNSVMNGMPNGVFENYVQQRMADSRVLTDRGKPYSLPRYTAGSPGFALSSGIDGYVFVAGSGKELEALAATVAADADPSTYRTVVFSFTSEGSKEFRIPLSSIYQAVGVSPSGVMRGPKTDTYVVQKDKKGNNHIVWENNNGSLVWFQGVRQMAAALPSSAITLPFSTFNFVGGLAPYYLKIGNFYYALMLAPQPAKDEKGKPTPDYKMIGETGALQGFVRSDANGPLYGIFVDANSNLLIKSAKNVFPDATDTAFLVGNFDNVVASDVLCAGKDFLEMGECRYIMRALTPATMASPTASSFDQFVANDYLSADFLDPKAVALIMRRMYLDPAYTEAHFGKEAKSGDGDGVPIDPTYPCGWCPQSQCATAVKLTLAGNRVVPGVLACGKYLATYPAGTTQTDDVITQYQFFYYDSTRKMVYALDANGMKDALISVPDEATLAIIKSDNESIRGTIRQYLDSFDAPRKLRKAEAAGEKVGAALGQAGEEIGKFVVGDIGTDTQDFFVRGIPKFFSKMIPDFFTGKTFK